VVVEMSGDIVVEYSLVLKGASDDRYSKLVDLAKTMAKEGSIGVFESKCLKAIGIDSREIESHEAEYEVPEDAYGNRIVLKFPGSDFSTEYGGISEIIGRVAGSVFSIGRREESSIQIIDIKFPKRYVDFFGGPNVGLHEVKKRTASEDKPLIAFTTKPRLGLDLNQYSKLLKEVVKGGIRFVEDDEHLVDPKNCEFDKRIKACVKAVREGEKEAKIDSGSTIYSTNITGRVDRIIERCDAAIEGGVRGLKLDVQQVGFSALSMLVRHIRENYSQENMVPITLYPSMNHMYETVFSRAVLLKIYRLLGADIVYAGSLKLVTRRTDDVIASVSQVRKWHSILRDSMDGFSVKPVLPTTTWGENPGTIERNYRLLDNKIAFFVGGGMMMHPNGPYDSACLIVKALECAMKKENLWNCLKNAGFDIKELAKLFKYESWDSLDDNIKKV